MNSKAVDGLVLARMLGIRVVEVVGVLEHQLISRSLQGSIGQQNQSSLD